jgi:hypothetical protein
VSFSLEEDFPSTLHGTTLSLAIPPLVNAMFASRAPPKPLSQHHNTPSSIRRQPAPPSPRRNQLQTPRAMSAPTTMPPLWRDNAPGGVPRRRRRKRIHPRRGVNL